MVFVMESRTKNVRDFVLKRAFLVDFLEHKSILSLSLSLSSVKKLSFFENFKICQFLSCGGFECGFCDGGSNEESS